MALDSGAQQVRIATFDGEPLARLWQQRLRQEDIPCVVKSLGAGSGAWGGSSFVPHAVYVLVRDRRRAIGVIQGTDSPEYLLDMASDEAAERRAEGSVRFLLVAAVAVLAIATALAFLATVR
jgi:hypothetical protein